MAEKIFKLKSPATVENITQRMETDLNLQEEQANESSGTLTEESLEKQDDASSAQDTVKEMVDAFELSKLCFLIGHIAIKEIAHIEAIEVEWKSRKFAGKCYLKMMFCCCLLGRV
jgi:condensin complex subunit 1